MRICDLLSQPRCECQGDDDFACRTVTLVDSACYGMVCCKGMVPLVAGQVEAPALIRFGQLTNDEFFVSETAARAGVRVTTSVIATRS